MEAVDTKTMRMIRGCHYDPNTINNFVKIIEHSAFRIQTTSVSWICNVILFEKTQLVLFEYPPTAPSIELLAYICNPSIHVSLQESTANSKNMHGDDITEPPYFLAKNVATTVQKAKMVASTKMNTDEPVHVTQS